MKKSKELLLFIIPFVFLTVCGFVSFYGGTISAVNVLSNQPKFVNLSNYIRLLINDKIFITALFNTYCIGVIPSLISVAVFALVVFLIRKKKRISRLVFYLSSAFIGSAASLVFTVYSYIQAFYTAQSLVSYQPPSFLESITLPRVLLALQIGVFTAFVFWIAELIYNKIKSRKTKG